MKVIKRITVILRDKHGAATYIEMAVLILVVMMLSALSISFLQIYAKHNLVNSMAHEMARYVEITGEVGSGAYAEFDRLKRVAGYTDATIDFDRTGRIPLEEPFTVTVSVRQKFGIGGVQVIPVTVRAVATGRSEKYWK